MIIYVDIDNTICETIGSDYHNSKPITKNISKINELYNKGNTIVYWTARGGSSGIDWTELTKKQLDDWNCLYHELSLDKPSFDVLFDDKAFKIDEL